MIPGIAILTLVAAWMRQRSLEPSEQEKANQLWVLWDLQRERESVLAPDGVQPWEDWADDPSPQLPPGWQWGYALGDRRRVPQRAFGLKRGSGPGALDFVLGEIVEQGLTQDIQLYVIYLPDTSDGTPRYPFIAVPHPGWTRALQRELICWLVEKLAKEDMTIHWRAREQIFLAAKKTREGEEIGDVPRHFVGSPNATSAWRLLESLDGPHFPLVNAMQRLTAMRRGPSSSGNVWKMSEAGVFQEVHDWINERLLRAELEP